MKSNYTIFREGKKNLFHLTFHWLVHIHTTKRNIQEDVVNMIFLFLIVETPARLCICIHIFFFYSIFTMIEI